MDPLKFEKSLDPVFRSRVANMVLGVIRDRRLTRQDLSPESVLAGWIIVCKVHIGDTEKWRDRCRGNPEKWDAADETATFWRGVLAELEFPEDDLWCYIDLRLRWDHMSPAEQETIKRRSKTGSTIPLSDRMPSEAQLTYLKALGYRGNDPENGLEASTLIAECRAKKGLR